MEEINPESPTTQPHAMPPQHGQDQSGLVREMAAMRKMLESQEKTLHSIRRTMRLATVVSVVRFLIFIVPLVLVLIFLPPFIERLLGTLQSFQGEGNNEYGLTLPKGLDLEQLEQLFRQSTTPER